MRLSVEDLLRDPTGEVTELRKLGLSDSALITFIVRVLEGEPRESALRALLAGRRSLTAEQVRFVRRVLSRLPAR